MTQIVFRKSKIESNDIAPGALSPILSKIGVSKSKPPGEIGVVVAVADGELIVAGSII